MAYKSIITIITDPVAERAALDAAIELTAREDGHLEVLCLGVDRTQPGIYYSGTSAIAMQTSLAEADEAAARVQKEVKTILDAAGSVGDIHPIAAQTGSLAQILGICTRLSDIAVLPKPYGDDREHEHEAIVEAALFDARIPVLIIPPNTKLPESLDTIVVAWNESREALIAVRHALPILKNAKVVNIAIIDPPVHAPDRSDPGGALSQMLSRHGVTAEVSILAKTMPRVSEVIERHMNDLNADLLVMGAYGHSRLRESILGGATRNMLQMAEIPVLMAH